MRRLWIVLAYVVAFSVVAPAVLADDYGTEYDDLYCDGNYSGIYVSGNVYVSFGDDCFLDGVSIDGNVIVDGGALRLFRSYVSGNVESSYAGRFAVEYNYIDGNVTAYKTYPYYRYGKEQAARLVGNEISGNVELYDNLGKFRVAHNEVYGNVDAYGNWGTVVVVHNYVDGNISAYENYGLVVIKYNRVCGDVEYYGNYGPVKVGYNDYC